MRRPFNGACVAVLCLATVVAACSRNAEGRSTPSPEHAGKIGDSTAFGVRIAGFNGPRNRATFILDEPAYVVALAVIPGKSIDPVARRPAADSAPESSGEHQVWIAMPRPVGIRATARSGAQLDYDRCVAQRSTASAQTQIATARRDSTGGATSEAIGSGGYSYYEPPESQCKHLLQRTRSGSPAAEIPDPNRFLVLIASNIRLTEPELLERLGTTTVDAKDVQTTIAGIADALYADRRAIWSGYYKRW